MDQTDFSLLVGLLVGTNFGALVLKVSTGWSWWLVYPLGGIVGLVLFAVLTFLLIELISRMPGRSRRKPMDDSGEGHC